jgi:cell division inhibitor SepF
MGIYLGLVEDDDTRGYGRYDARQGDYAEHPDDRRYGRYVPEDAYDERYEEYEKPGYHPAPYGGPAYEEPDTKTSTSEREPEPAAPRAVSPARPIGLAPASPAGASARSGGASAAAAMAVREEPKPKPKPEPASTPPAPAYRITTVHPRTYNEARTIGERYREGCPVIMNLTELDDADAKRLVDFAAGLIFGLRGSIERVTAKVFLLSPQDVDVTAEDKARIREGGFFNQS